MRARPIPLVLAIGALAASGGYLLSDQIRDSSPVAIASGHWVYSWVALLFLGGGAALYGWAARREEWEALGLIFAGFGGLAYVFAIIATRGLRGWTAACLIGSASISHLLRARDLTKLRRRV